MTRHPFSFLEANALLPEVEAVFARVDQIRIDLDARHTQVQLLEGLWGDKLTESGNPDHLEFLAHRDAILRGVDEIERLIQTRLLDRGVRVPAGGLEVGLADFPSTLEGRWVYLCWRRGEAEVGHFHEIQGGFAGRRPLTPDVSVRLALADDPARLDDSVLDF